MFSIVVLPLIFSPSYTSLLRTLVSFSSLLATNRAPGSTLVSSFLAGNLPLHAADLRSVTPPSYCRCTNWLRLPAEKCWTRPSPLVSPLRCHWQCRYHSCDSNPRGHLYSCFSADHHRSCLCVTHHRDSHHPRCRSRPTSNRCHHCPFLPWDCTQRAGSVRLFSAKLDRFSFWPRPAQFKPVTWPDHTW